MIISIALLQAYVVHLAAVPIAGCLGENHSTVQRAFDVACQHAYPGPALFYEDGLREIFQTQKQNGSNEWAGLQINSTNTTVTNCDAITQVYFCYKWWSATTAIQTCDVSISNDGGQNYATIDTTCPGTTEPAGPTCVDVTSTVSWTCENFFGDLGAFAESEVAHDGTGTNGYFDIIWDVFYFNVSYNKTKYPPTAASIFVDDDISTPADEVSLNPGTTRQVWCNGTLTDQEGFGDIASVSGAFFASSTTADSAQDNTNNYKDADCTTTNTNINGEFACSFDVYFFAENNTWTCQINATDSFGDWNLNTTNTTITELLAISTDSATLDLGTLRYPETTGTSDTTQIIYNEGNVPFDLLIDTYNDSVGSSSSFTCTIGYVPVENLRASQTANQDVNIKTSASAAGTLAFDFNLSKQTDGGLTSATQKNVYWGFIAPQAVFGSCSGIIQYAAIADS